MANRGTSVDGGWKLVSSGLCVFSGSFGVRSIVLCKCSGKVLIGYELSIVCSHSFRGERLCLSQLINYTDQVTSLLVSEKADNVINLDFAKASHEA